MLESKEANALILEASEDLDGMILRVRSMGVTSIYTNGKEFSAGLSARELANVEHGLNLLARFGYVQQVQLRQTYLVTAQGYEYADSLATLQ